MPPEIGTFEAFYASPLQHPFLLFAAAALGVAACLIRRDLQPDLRRYCVALFVLSLADAWLTSSPIPGLGAAPGWLRAAIPLGFVLAGDARFLLLVTAATPDGRLEPTLARLAATAALTAVVPIVSQVVMLAMPEGFDTPRVLYLVYEVAFAALVVSLLRWHPRARALPWVRSVGRFVCLYYVLWAVADLLILTTGSDLGYALRVVPNWLYYGGLIAAIGRCAPGRPDR